MNKAKKNARERARYALSRAQNIELARLKDRDKARRRRKQHAAAVNEYDRVRYAKQRDEILAKVEALEDQARRESPNLSERMAKWEQSLGAAAGQWTVLDPKEWMNFATKFEKQPDLSLLGGGDVKPGGTMKVWVDTELRNITGFRCLKKLGIRHATRHCVAHNIAPKVPDNV